MVIPNGYWCDGVTYTARMFVPRRCERGDIQALRIDRHRDELRAGGPKRAMRAEVAGLLDRDAVIRLEQRRGREPERRLGSGHDEHLIGHAPHRPRRHGDARRSQREGHAARPDRCTTTVPESPRARDERPDSPTRRAGRDPAPGGRPETAPSGNSTRRRRLIGHGALAERRRRPRRRRRARIAGTAANGRECASLTNVPEPVLPTR